MAQAALCNRSMASVTIDYNAIERGLSASLNKFAQGQDAAYKATIADVIYPWPNRTKRKNGETAGSPRNIVDKGAFRNSQSYSIQGLRAVWIWDIDYAVFIFFGYSVAGEFGVAVTGRDWIAASHQQSDPLEALAGACRNVFR